MEEGECGWRALWWGNVLEELGEEPAADPHLNFWAQPVAGEWERCKGMKVAVIAWLVRALGQFWVAVVEVWLGSLG